VLNKFSWYDWDNTSTTLRCDRI